MHRVKINHPRVSLQRICGLLNITRQAYYQYIESQREKSLEEQIILELVRQQRQDHPTMGAVAILENIREDLTTNGIKIGRDALLDLLWRNGLQTRRRKRKRLSLNSSIANDYPNLMVNRDTTNTNEAVVADFTYVPTLCGKFLYLSMITDAYSRCIIGWHVSSSIKTVDVLQALKMATKTIGDCRGVIHHSDNGSQYLSKEYTDYLKKQGMLISTTAPKSPHENGKAERLHSTIKSGYLHFCKIRNLKDAEREIKNIIFKYNNKRPHQSISYKKPAEVYKYNLRVERKWKNRRKKRPSEII